MPRLWKLVSGPILTILRPENDYNFHTISLEDVYNTPTAPSTAARQSRTSYRSRRAGLRIYLRKLLWIVPTIFLAILGVIHILQVCVGRAYLFLDTQERIFRSNFEAQILSSDTDTLSALQRTREIHPIPCHSHNDYWRQLPLFEALHWGCTSVEADVWLFEDELYVGHSIPALKEQDTLRRMYVDPIIDLLDRRNLNESSGNSTPVGVFERSPDQTLVILIDFKTEGRRTFPHVYDQLQPLRDRGYLTYFDGEKRIDRPITVVGSGNTPFDMVTANGTYRDIFFDAPLKRLWDPPFTPLSDEDERTAIMDYGTAMAANGYQSPSNQGEIGTETITSGDAFNSTNSYYASVSLRSAVGFVWRGHLSPRQMNIIRGQIRGAKRRNLKVRYWDLPIWPIALRNHVWHVLVKEGMDMLNVDDLPGAVLATWNERHSTGWFA